LSLENRFLYFKAFLAVGEWLVNRPFPLL